ncbi:hypothetical protein LP419_01640 [Massilia sp. H-1]|nr:hypothetical protein LP419_01640 [Massilia sp. H-1]
MIHLSYLAIGAVATGLLVTLMLAAWLTPAHWWRQLNARHRRGRPGDLGHRQPDPVAGASARAGPWRPRPQLAASRACRPIWETRDTATGCMKT